MNDNTKQLLATRMTRSDFLKLAGFGVLSLLGVSNFLSQLHSRTQPPTARGAVRQPSRGFGSSKFGV